MSWLMRGGRRGLRINGIDLYVGFFIVVFGGSGLL